VTDCDQDIMKDAVDNGIKSVTQIPYFEGDFWPNVLEDCAKALDNDDEQDKHSQESTIDGDTEDSSCSSLPCSEPFGKVQHSLLSDCCCCWFVVIPVPTASCFGVVRLAVHPAAVH